MTLLRATLLCFWEGCRYIIACCYYAAVITLGGLLGVGVVFIAIPAAVLAASTWIAAHITYVP